MAGTAAVAWAASTSSGGGARFAAEQVVAQVARSARLTPFCRAVAVSVVESQLRARIAERRPTGRILAADAGESLDAWDASRCPVAALPGLTFGVADAARAALAERELR